MPNTKRQKNQLPQVSTRVINTGIYQTYEKHVVLDDGTDISLSKFPVQSHEAILAGEVLQHIADEVSQALNDDSDFKGEAADASEMLERLQTAMAESPVNPETVMYWSYFLGRAMERHHTRKYERNAKIGKNDQERRSKGGKSRRALKTAEEIQQCYDLIDEYRGPRISPTETCNRVAAELSRKLNRSVSSSTIKRQWKERGDYQSQC